MQNNDISEMINMKRQDISPAVCVSHADLRHFDAGHFGATNSAQVKLGAGQTRRKSNSTQVKLGLGQTRLQSNSARKKNELTLLYSA